MWPYPAIIAHRGGGSLAPENTLEGFQRGFNCGFRAVEFDVMLTKDLVPVVIHDEELGRTVAGQGLICEMQAHDLMGLDAGSWYGAGYSQARVPSFVQVLEFCTGHGIWMNIEIKPAHGFEEITAKIVAETTRNFYQNTNFPLPLLSSFAPSALVVAKMVAPGIPRGALFDRIPENWLEQIHTLSAVSLHTNQRYLTPALAAAVRQAGIGLACYTVNDPERAREIMGWGVDALFTDKLELIGPDFR